MENNKKMKMEDAEIIEELRKHGYTHPKKTLRDIKRGLEDAKAGRVSKVKDGGSFSQYVEEVEGE